MITSLANLTTFNISQDFFEKIARKVFEVEKRKDNVSVEVVLLGQDRMRNINKKYAGKNQVTEVLSFSDEEIKKPTKKELVFIQSPEAPKTLGEIVLCPSKIKKNAKKFRKNFEEELAFVFVHGLLHLLGYDHQNTEETKEMRKKEKEILKKIIT